MVMLVWVPWLPIWIVPSSLAVPKAPISMLLLPFGYIVAGIDSERDVVAAAHVGVQRIAADLQIADTGGVAVERAAAIDKGRVGRFYHGRKRPSLGLRPQREQLRPTNPVSMFEYPGPHTTSVFAIVDRALMSAGLRILSIEPSTLLSIMYSWHQCPAQF
jgi:hypothetical protein